MFETGPEHFNEKAGRRSEFFLLEFPPHLDEITLPGELVLPTRFWLRCAET